MKFSRSLFGSTLPTFIILEMIFMMCRNPEVWIALPRVNIVLFQVAFVATNCDDISHTLCFCVIALWQNLLSEPAKSETWTWEPCAESRGWFLSDVVTHERDMEVGAPSESGGCFPFRVVTHERDMEVGALCWEQGADSRPTWSLTSFTFLELPSQSLHVLG